MIKYILQVVIVLSIVILALGIMMGLSEYAETGSLKMLVLSGIGVILWIPTMILAIKYINEKEEE